MWVQQIITVIDAVSIIADATIKKTPHIQKNYINLYGTTDIGTTGRYNYLIQLNCLINEPY
jgi:hypothetical protein